jgi:hypothetical protein
MLTSDSLSSALLPAAVLSQTMSMMPTMAGGDSDEDRAEDLEEGKAGKKKKTMAKASSGNVFDDLDSIVVGELVLSHSQSLPLYLSV